MLGAIIGDIAGSTREWNNVKSEDFELIPQGSHFTDDTVITLAVAEWLMRDPHHQKETLVECIQTLGKKYYNAGYGGMFRKWLLLTDPQPYGSFGNGSAMRVSPVAMYASSLDEALELARISAEVTHNHPEGIKGAQAIAACVYLKKNGREAEIKSFVEQTFGYDLDIKLEDIRDEYTFDVTCQGSVPIAIMAYLQRDSHSPEQALRLAISMGGDSDTIACMTCSIAFARPSDISDKDFLSVVENTCRELMPANLLDINDRFEAFINNPDKKDSKKNSIADSIRGSLMAGAAGDALGYTVEFMRRNAILAKYGDCGITCFELDRNGKALISDDTQMTLFTANGMLMGLTRGYMRGIGGAPEKYMRNAYIDWYYTQVDRERNSLVDGPHSTWLYVLPEMAHRRAPGITCLNACVCMLKRDKVENDSKGCGGIMRVAPIALLAASSRYHGKEFYDTYRLAAAGAEIAEVTHKHPLGFLPAAMLTHLLARLVPLSVKEAKESIADIAEEAIMVLGRIHTGEFLEHKNYLADLTYKAIRLAHSDIDDASAIKQLGEGWVAEETWAIALYCAIRHIDSVENAIIASVNHDGDSDSTGSVTGNIMGAIHGYAVIKKQRIFCPDNKELEDTLELSNIILAIADDLYTGCIISENDNRDTPEKRQWFERYCKMKPAGI